MFSFRWMTHNGSKDTNALFARRQEIMFGEKDLNRFHEPTGDAELHCAFMGSDGAIVAKFRFLPQFKKLR